jgi:hypothetical protein
VDSKRKGFGGKEEGEDKQLRLPLCVAARLTERDEAALHWLVEQRAATVSQLTTLLGYLGDGPITERRGAMVMSRWEALGLVERKHVWWRHPAVVMPTSEGARYTGRTKWRKPAIGTLNHTLHSTQVRLQTCRPGSDKTWRTEEQLRYALPGGTRIPDGAIVESDGAMTAVEVELTSHGRRRVREAMTSLLAVQRGGEDFFHHVLYLCSPEVMTQVTAVRADLPESVRARVVVLPCPSP